MIKIIPIKSKLNKKNKIEILKKINIKNKIEFIGFIENTINKDKRIKKKKIMFFIIKECK